MIWNKSMGSKIYFSPVRILVLLIGFSFFQGCYTLSGSSIDPNWNTLNVSVFPNYAPYQNPNLSQEFTMALQDIFNNRTKLSLTTDQNADLLIDGEITGYQQSSVAIQPDEIAGKNRLTVTVKVRYQNNKDESKSFEKNFTAYDDFDANQTLQQAESALLDSIIEQLTNEIFNAIAMDW